VARMVERRRAYRVLVGIPQREKGHLEDVDLDGRIILRRIVTTKRSGVDWIYLA